MRHFLLCTVFALSTIVVTAGHRPGGEYTWSCLNDSTYVITYIGWVDCAHNYDKKTKYCLEGSMAGDPNDGTYEVDSAYTIDFPVPFCPGVPTCQGNGYYNWQSITVYTDTIVLQQPLSPWYTIQHCDGGNRPTAINTSGGYYVESSFSIVVPCNSSPYPTSYHDAIFCIGDSACIQNDFVDPDGDSLVFYLTNCLEDPGQSLTYNPPYTPTNPLTSGIGWNIDSVGNVCFLPTQQEHGTVCLMIEEWRNGVLISNSIQDMYINFIDCDISLPADTPEVTDVVIVNEGCSGTIITTGFDEASIIYNSIDPLPIGAYNSYLSCAAGCDTTLVTAQPGYPPYVDYQVCGLPIAGCNTVNMLCDTVRVYFYSVLDVAINPQSPAICFGTGSTVITANGSGGVGPYSYLWSTGHTTQNLTVTAGGWYYVTLTDQSSPPCNTSIDSVFVDVFTLPISSDAGPDQVICAGDTVDLGGSVQIASGGVWLGGGGQYFPDSTSLVTQYLPSGTEIANGQVSLVLLTTGNATCPPDADTMVVDINTVRPAIDSIQPVSCFGGNDGYIQVGVVGGTPSFIFNWNTVPPQTGFTATGLTAGTYTVTVSDINGCDSVLTATVTEPPLLTAAVDSTNNVTCNGGNDGWAVVSGGGGTTPYSYNWSTIPAQTTAMAAGLVAGNYSVTLTDANGCDTVLAITITEPTPVVATITGLVNVSCNGGGDGQATASGSGGTSGFTYSWNTTPVQTTATATGLSSGTYIVFVTDASGCADSASVLITQPSILASTINTVTHVSCFGGSDGSATVSANGGTPPYAYNWNTTPAQTNATATGLPVGTYSVTVTDVLGCTSISSITINEPTALAGGVLSSTDVGCNGDQTGLATASVTGGVPSYGFVWNTSPAQTLSTATGLGAGTYDVTITDYNGCVLTDQVTIAEPPLLAISITGTTDVSCFGGSDGQATAAAAGGTSAYSYQWSTVPSQSGTTATGLAAGSYTVTVTDANGCTALVTAVISEPPLLTLSTSTMPANCGNPDGSATVSATGGTTPYIYAWSTAPVQTTATATGLVTGSYTVTVTDNNGCIDTTTTNVNDLVVNATLASQTNVTCYGGSNGQATVSATGGTTPYAFSWNTTPVQTSATSTGLTAGSYTAVVIDVNGCQSSFSVTITEPLPIINTDTVVNVSCNGGSDGQITVYTSGQSPPYTYLWNTVPPQTTATATGLSAGSYSVTVTDNIACDTTAVINVTEAPLLVSGISGSTNVSCNGGSDGDATANASGGVTPYTYVWSTVPVQNTATATGLQAGTYSVSLTDANGCVSISSVTITEPTALNASIGSSAMVSCNGTGDGQATVTATGGTTPYGYSWNTVPTQTTATATGLGPGNYTVTVTDGNGCQASTSITITQPAVLVTTNGGVVHVGCFGGSTGSASVAIAGGTPAYSYSWNTVPVQTGSTATGLVSGNYQVTVTDVNGCTSIQSFTVNEPTMLGASITSSIDVLCNGGNNGQATVGASGGTPAYNYVWSTVPVQNGSTATGLSAGVYSVTVSDLNNCDTVVSITITEPAVFSAMISSNDVGCFGGNNGDATVNPSGGTGPYFYNWNTVPVQTTQLATGLLSGIYTVTVTDNNGCTTLGNVNISEPTPLSSYIQETDISCFGSNDGTGTATTGGGTPPYSFNWSTAPPQTAATATGLSAGNYSVTVTDAQGCDTIMSITINEPGALTVAPVTQTNVSCNGGYDGVGEVAAGGGIPGYTYTWNTVPPQTAATATGLIAGTYQVTATDTNGCTAVASITITEPALLNVSLTGQVNVSCFGGNDGSATALISGGTPAYTYSWLTIPAQTTPSATGLGAGTYPIIAMDANGCMDTGFATITEPAQISAVISNIVYVSCFEANDGQMTVTASNGTAPYTYLWSNGQAGQTATGLAHGNYTVTVTDANGCSVVTSDHVHEPDELWGIELFNNDETCPGAGDGSVAVNGVDGTPPYTFVWNTVPPQIGNNATGLAAGNYLVTITDANGCDTVLSVTVGVNVLQPADLQVSLSDTVACAGDSVQLSLVVQNVQSTYTYSWNNGLGTSAGPFTVAAQTNTTYSVTVTDDCGNWVSDSITLQIEAYPLVALPSLIADGCVPLVVSFTDTAGNAPGMNYVWEFGDGNSSTSNAPTHTYANVGTYNVTVTISSPFGCVTVSSGSSQVVIHPDPVSDFTPHPAMVDLQNPSISFTDNSSNDVVGWLWDFGDGGSDTLQHTSHTYQDTGNYMVTLTVWNQYGCENSVTKPVWVNPWYELIVPNAFSPSSSGSNGGAYDATSLDNNVFFPFTEFVDEFHMMIFNRWGELVFESFDIDVGWDGYYRGELSQQDVYAYKIKVKYIDGNEVTKVGNVTLFR